MENIYIYIDAMTTICRKNNSDIEKEKSNKEKTYLDVSLQYTFM